MKGMFMVICYEQFSVSVLSSWSGVTVVWYLSIQNFLSVVQNLHERYLSIVVYIPVHSCNSPFGILSTKSLTCAYLVTATGTFPVTIPPSPSPKRAETRGRKILHNFIPSRDGPVNGTEWWSTGRRDKWVESRIAEWRTPLLYPSANDANEDCPV